MRNRVVQIGLSLALLVLLIQVVLIAPSQIRDAETKAAIIPAPELPAKTEGVDQSIQGMHMIETREGKKEWELWSEKAVSIKAKEIFELDQVKAIFFTDSGVTFNVTGRKGVAQTKTKDLSVSGDVVIRSSNGYVFRTDEMNYASLSRLISTEAKVDMVGPKDVKGHAMKLSGAAMQARLDQSTIEVMREVRAEKPLGEGRRVLIKSQRAAFSGEDRSAKFVGDVVLDMDTMRITGPEALFAYDSKRDLIKTVSFTGGARVSDQDKWATAQNVRVDFESNKYIFRGNPRVMQNNDELRGEEIVFLDGGKRVQVQGARAKVDEKRLEQKN
jgi:LPS export ABC transporter protein LptC/lipopolysaccharide transport protein LptA